MDRRTFLGTVTVAALAGCGGGGPEPTPTADRDGYPPPPAETPPERSIDVDGFRRLDIEGIEVPLAPVGVAHYWHQRREARFADARGRRQYDRSHVHGAVLSTAPDGVDDADPTNGWPQNDRIVCYCGCPHHLSSLRAATLIASGYERVYVIDEGFWEWVDRGYPVAGARPDDRPRLRRLTGRTNPSHAGGTVLLVHEPSGQREAAPIRHDGTYVLHVRFSSITDSSVMTLETPARTIRAPLGDLSEDGR